MHRMSDSVTLRTRLSTQFTTKRTAIALASRPPCGYRRKLHQIKGQMGIYVYLEEPQLELLAQKLGVQVVQRETVETAPLADAGDGDFIRSEPQVRVALLILEAVGVAANLETVVGAVAAWPRALDWSDRSYWRGEQADGVLAVVASGGDELVEDLDLLLALRLPIAGPDSGHKLAFGLEAHACPHSCCPLR